MRVDLTKATPEQLARILHAVTLRGAEDEANGEPEMIGKQLVEEYAFEWLRGHERVFRHAYYAGRWHAQSLKKLSQEKSADGQEP